MRSIEWLGSRVRLIDQTKLPLEETTIETDDFRVLAEAISALRIRGAPAIGVAAAYGVALAALTFPGTDFQEFSRFVHNAAGELNATRPTAVNLSWSVRRMKRVLDLATSTENARQLLVDEALGIHREDEEMCRKIGEHGSSLIPESATILTHCNTGALATGGDGTAQSVITTAFRQGKSISVYASETRPTLQGARLTAWELMKLGVDVTLITDSMACFLMKKRKITCVIVGADRIAANGDTANKIGTYNHAVTARYHGIPFYVAAPSSTIDPATGSGDQIPIEERNPKEVTEGFGRRTAPEGIKVYSPAFDITAASLISAIITERGIHRPPFHFHEIGPSRNA